LLIRNRWIQLLTLLLFILFGFAVYNGMQKVEARHANIASAEAELKTQETAMLLVLDSLEKGQKVSLSKWRLPSRPVVFGNTLSRVVSMPAKPTAFIATGQSDLFTHYVKPTVTGDDLSISYTEMTSPVQLLFGSFDLAFVIIYLLPLLIIAFSFNVLAAERESGTLKLLASQPIRIRTWVLQKLALRFFWLIVCITITLLIVFAIFSFDFGTNSAAFGSLLLYIIVYALFWFVLAFATNIWIHSSAKNAIALIGFWVIFVLLSPSILNQLSNSLYPMPSRTLMLNQMRTLKAEATKKQDEILDNYLRDHPEYATNDSTQTRNFYHSYMATKSLVKEELRPVVKKFETQLKNQQQWAHTFSWLSPALTVQNALNDLAGTSEKDYQEFRSQSLAFAEEWRDFFLPFMFKNQEIKKSDHKLLPTFEFSYTNEASSGRILGLLVMSLVIIGLVFVLKPKQQQIHIAM
jgi:ABC-2 type transport system permease protein